MLRCISPCCFWMGLHPHTRNVLQLGIGFFFIFLAFNSQGFIEESVLDSYAPGTVPKHAGYTSLSIIYASFTVLNFVAPPIISLLGTRTSLLLAGLTYVLFLAGFLFINTIFLYFSSALLGLGAAVIWTAQGKYLTLNSSAQSAGKHSSLFLAIFFASLSCGGVFLLVVFLITDHSSSSSFQSSANSSLPPISSPSTAPSFDHSTVKFIYGSFTGIALIGVIVLALLPECRKRISKRTKMGEVEKSKDKKESDEQRSWMEQTKSIFTVAASVKMVALAFVFGYSGILLSFWSSIFPTALINTIELQSQFSPKILIALNGIFKGVGQPLLSALFGWFRLDRIKQSRLVFCGLLIHLLSFLLVFLNLPNESPLLRTQNLATIRPSVFIALFCGFLLSFGDAFWTTQIFTFLITNYPDKSAEAFALFKFYQSLLTCILFYLSGHLPLHWHLLILFCSAILGYLAFVVAEKLAEKDEEHRRRKTDAISMGSRG